MKLFPVYGLLVISFYNGEPAIVKTEQGDVKGQELQSRGGRPFYAFYRIPYAEPPVGELRFQNPKPAESWTGVRDGTILPPPCLHILVDKSIHGEEDCLYLNVYTPKLANNSLPVIVFIYGGRFMYGDALPGKYGPHYFMDKNVVLITFHYRLGIFGFLSTEDNVIPGNYGMKDMVAVLHWVQNYIDSFGGDKNRVTVFGASSGGASASLILISPAAKGLFHRVISQSGQFLEIEKFGVTRRKAWKIAALFGCNETHQSQQLLMCLRNKPAIELVKKNLDLFIFGNTAPNLPWGPIIENEDTPDAFLVDEPVKLYQRKTDIPWITGMNSADGAMMTIYAYFNPNAKVIDIIEDDYYKYFPMTFHYTHFTKNQDDLNTVTDVLKKHYFGDSKIKDNPQGFSKMQNDFTFLLGLNETVTLYNGPLYLYFYDHRNEETFAQLYGNVEKEMGVNHGDELISMFNWTDYITPVTKGVDLKVSEKIIDLWTNFATKGDPNNENEIIWKPVKLPNINYLHIKNGSFVERDEFMKEELNFLENLKKSYT